MTSKIKVDNISDQNDNNIINESGDVITVGAAGDTVAVAGNIVKSNAYQASDGGVIISQSGTTITIGASGDTVSLASGASQSGFGRAGSVDWQTGSIKTSTFTAASGEGYFVDTSSAAVTANLPAGSAGAIVSFSDYTRTFGTNRLTVTPNGSEKIGGVAESAFLTINGQAATFVYVDGTEGWINVQNAEDTEAGVTPAFIAATGGTVSTVCTNFKVHTFTGPGTFSVSAVGNAAGSETVDYLVIAGGGGGGSDQGGGGGAGGYRESSGAVSGAYTRSPLGACVSALPVTATGFPITVGGGGQGAIIGCRAGANGNTSTFSSISSAGGGKAGTLNSPGVGSAGGSGGGGSHGGCGGAGGAGNTPPVAPPQGTPGGNAPSSSDYGAAGGGATSAGVNGNSGSAGGTSSITGSPVGRAGGGGGRTSTGPAGVPFGAGTYTPNPSPGAQNGTANTGSGAGGSGVGGPAPTNVGGTGGSGIVIIRYKFQ